MRILTAVIVVAAVAGLGWRTLRIKWHSSYPSADGALTPTQARENASALAIKDRVQAADLDVNFAPSTGSIELLIDGQRFFPRIRADIEAAQSSVHVIEYEFRSGEIGDQFASLLKRKAQDGVEVKLIVDQIGSAVAVTSRELFDDLAAAGVQIVHNDPVGLDLDGLRGGEQALDWRFDELAHADHRKLFVIDGRVAWVGSAGIADHFADGRFHDVFVRTEGEVVSYLQTLFLTSFRFLGGPLPKDPLHLAAYYPTPSAVGEGPITVLHNVPQAGHLANTDAMASLFEGATRRIDVISPYTADRPMLERLMAAARRGVAVRFIAPADSNSWATAGAFEHYIADLQAAGVEVWLHPVFPHAKVMLADDRVLVGSTNMDAWALYRNWEVGLLIEDARVAETFRRDLFDADISRSIKAEPPTNPLIRAKDSVLAALGPLI